MSALGKHLLRWLPLLGIGILAVLVARVDWAKMWAVLSGVRGVLLLAAFPCSFVYVASKSWRWSWMLQRQGLPAMAFRTALAIYYATFYLGLLTPGKAGDAAKLFYLTGRGVRAGRAAVSVVLDRGLDIVFLGIMGVVAAAWLPRASVGLWWSLAVLAAGAVGLIILVACRRVLWSRLLRLVPARFRDAVAAGGDDFSRDLKKLGWREYAVLALITVACWAVAYLQVWLLAISLSIAIGYGQIVLLSTVVSLLGILPVSPSGTNIGTRDAALVVGFSWLAIGSAEQALGLSTLMLLVIIFDAFCGYLAFVCVPIRTAPAAESATPTNTPTNLLADGS